MLLFIRDLKHNFNHNLCQSVDIEDYAMFLEKTRLKLVITSCVDFGCVVINIAQEMTSLHRGEHALQLDITFVS